MTTGIANCCWPAHRLGDALQAVAAGGRSSSIVRKIGNPPSTVLPAGSELEPGLSPEQLDVWMTDGAAQIGLETESLSASLGQLAGLLQARSPVLLRVRIDDAPCVLALLPDHRGRLYAVAPSGGRQRIDHATLRSLVMEQAEQPLQQHVMQLLRTLRPNVNPDAARAHRTRAAVWEELLGESPVVRGWLLRPAASEGMLTQLRQGQWFRLLAVFAFSHAANYACWIGAWWLLGASVLQGRLDLGWLLAWGLILLTMIPFRLLVEWTGGLMAIRLGTIIKQRLMLGALHLEADAVRRLGAGQYLGRVIESESIERLALNGGFVGLTCAVELLFATLVLLAGPGGWLSILLLLGWLAFTGFCARRFWQAYEAWTSSRAEMTTDLVEQMVGHRTRLAQPPPERWTAQEYGALSEYHGRSQRLDASSIALRTRLPRGWFAIGILGLAPAFVTGASSSGLAIGIGGVLLVYMVFHKLGTGLEQLIAAVVAARRIQMFSNDVRPADRESAGLRLTDQRVPLAHGHGTDPSTTAQPLLEAKELTFHYPHRRIHVIRDTNLLVSTGENLLLEGTSGCGKSTLAKLLAHSRQSDSGLILLRGFDQQTLGQRQWRQRVALIPQTHENYVFLGSVAFNTMLGHRGPTTAHDVQRAESVLRGLGLGPLLDRMPAGIQTLVGETGWQLSEGEKTRLFIARGLLQDPDLLILDESLAALDPASLIQCGAFLRTNAKTLFVIAHP